MGRNSTYIFSWVLIIALVVFMSHAFAFGPQLIKSPDTINYFNAKKSKKKGPLTFSLSLPPTRPGVISTTRASLAQANDKLLSNVEVYPNPVTDQINLKYIISRNSNVSIKVMDILGNNIFTLFSQRVEPGERSFNYSLNNKLQRGFYFIRLDAGTEFVVKRISVL